MVALTESGSNSQVRTYSRAGSVVFLKTNEPFGGLSNMAGGFPLCVNGIRILTSEALYQACRFPHRPEVQWLIIGQPSPMTAKMKSKPYRQDSRPDWDRVRVKIMRWCLRVKLAQNWDAFSKLLLETGDRPIVEQSRKDEFWGAKPVDDHTLVGMNVLGRLLMELREVIKVAGQKAVERVEPVAIPDFLLGGRPVETVTAPGEGFELFVKPMRPATYAESMPAAKQVSFLDLELREARPPEYRGEGAEHTASIGLSPYPAMKDSGVPWLGEVPAHWEVMPAVAIYQPKLVKNAGMVEQTVLSLSYGRIVVKPQEKLHGLVPESFETYQIIDPGDIIVRTTDLQNDKSSLRVGHAQDRGIITSAYMCLKTTDRVLDDFGYYILNAYDLLKIIYGYGAGLRQNIDFSHIRRMPAPVPPRDQQALIIRFLNYMDRQIRRYIRAKQKLIKLLEEQKQAIVHRAVTRGLDPGVRLKPSGVEWLGVRPSNGLKG